MHPVLSRLSLDTMDEDIQSPLLPRLRCTAQDTGMDLRHVRFRSFTGIFHQEGPKYRLDFPITHSRWRSVVIEEYSVSSKCMLTSTLGISSRGSPLPPRCFGLFGTFPRVFRHHANHLRGGGFANVPGQRRIPTEIVPPSH